MTKAELQDYYHCKLEIRSIEESIMEIETSLQNVAAKPITDQPMNHNSFLVDKQSELMIKKLELEEKLLNRHRYALFKIEQIENAISLVDDPMERTVLRLRYIQCMKWEDISQRIGYEISQTYQIHRNALVSISNIVISP